MHPNFDKLIHARMPFWQPQQRDRHQPECMQYEMNVRSMTQQKKKLKRNTLTLSPSAMCASTLPVAGLMVVNVLPDTASTNWLLMKIYGEMENSKVLQVKPVNVRMIDDNTFVYLISWLGLAMLNLQTNDKDSNWDYEFLLHSENKRRSECEMNSDWKIAVWISIRGKAEISVK